MASRIPLNTVCEQKIETLSSQYDGKIEYIDISSIDNVEKTISNTQIINSKEAPSRARQLVKNGDILVSTVRPNLNAVAVVKKESDYVLVASTGYCVLRCNSEIDSHYVFHFCQSPYFIDDMVRQATGASYPAVSNLIVRSCLVPLRSLEEQQHIATVLDKLTDLISLRKQQLAKLDELVKARFVEMFGDQTSNNMEWEQSTIGECCELKSGISLPIALENEGGNIPYIKVGDMNYPGNEYYITTSSRYVTEKTAGKGIFPTGTVIFPKRGGAIGTNKKRLTKLPICADLNVMGVIAGNKLLPNYLMTFFEMIDLGSLDNGSSVPQINNKDIAPLIICLPPLNLQKGFSNFVEQTNRQKLTIQQSLDKMEVLKKSLMQEYFG